MVREGGVERGGRRLRAVNGRGWDMRERRGVCVGVRGGLLGMCVGVRSALLGWGWDSREETSEREERGVCGC